MNIIKRYLPFALLSAIALYAVFTPAMISTVIAACVACLLCVVMSELSQFFYTKINWTDADTETDGHTRALGQIYLGNAILIGLVFLGVFFLNVLKDMTGR